MQFTKYHGSGNDFILVDNRNQQWEEFLASFSLQEIVTTNLPQNNKTYAKENQVVFELCHRNFGIGADGLMLLQASDLAHFEMIYFNSDGHLSTMCGNGGRCIAHFAATLGISNRINQAKHALTFIAPDGQHSALVDLNEQWVELSMQSVNTITKSELSSNAWVLHTGSPHYVEFSTKPNPNEGESFLPWAKSIRYSNTYAAQGINVNWVDIVNEETIAIRTYERGVENETFSCGTGVTAAAIAFGYTNLPRITMVNKSSDSMKQRIQVETKGGILHVTFEVDENNHFTNVVLAGPSKPVFVGTL